MKAHPLPLLPILQLAAAALLLITAPATAQTVTTGSLQIKLTAFATVPSASGSPQDVVSANDGTGRLFIATRNGDILLSDANGALAATPFLEMAGAGISVFTAGEGGFPGLAFSPNFSTAANVAGSGKFYTFATETYNAANPVDFSHPELAPLTGTPPSNHIVIREWSVSRNPNMASTTSRVLMRINQPQANHQGGGLKFGLEGNLYIALGDGGGSNDRNGSATSPTDGHTNAVGNAQDTSVVYGKILRIDPNGSNSANGQYGIPAGNPFTTGSEVKEIFAYGLRNPYRISVDRLTGNLFAGDVGQNQREEVDLITSGGNYGWVFREGTRDNTADSGRLLPGGFSSIAPIGEYTHDDGRSIIGGFVYRGSLLPSLYGKYVFGDLNSRLFYMEATGGQIFEFQYDTSAGGLTPPADLFGWGEDAGGELLAMFAGGQVLRIVPEPSAAVLLSAAFFAAGFFHRTRS